MEKLFEEYNSNGKKTVLLVNDNYYPIVDGVLKVVENYAAHLQDRMNVVVCVPVHKWNVPEAPFPVLFCNSVYFAPIKYDYSRASSDEHMHRLLDKLRIDLIHIHSPYFTGRFMINYANAHNIPVISTFHTQYHRDLKRILKLDALSNKVLEMLMKVFYLSDKVLTLNETSLTTLRSYGYDGEVEILHNGTDMTFDGNKQELNAKAENACGLAPDDTVFLFVGRLTKGKNIYLILDCLKILFDEGMKFKMLYVGDGEEAARLKAKVKSLKMENCVTLTGKILDRDLLKAIYCRADLFLFPSVYDSDSVVKYEAAAFGTPSVLLEGSNDACSVQDNVSGFLCKGTAQDMAHRVKEIMNDPALLKTVGETAREKLYNPWDKIVDRVFEIYCDLIDKQAKTHIVKGKKEMNAALKVKYRAARKARKAKMTEKS